MATQTQRGKAFEYACLNAMKNELSVSQNVVIEKNHALDNAMEYYNNIGADTACKMDKAAGAAVRIIFRLEPQLQNPDGNSPLYLSIQEDAKGKAGDVRDVLCMRRQNGWEIGLSCKHNHAAVKHSRLSYTIDFGAKWFGKPCSASYFNEIQPLFDKLSSQTKSGIKWDELRDKEDKVYVPLLNAFVSELKRLDSKNNDIPASLLKYLLGRNDFYKIIADDTQELTKIQVYNIFGSLNKNSLSVKPEIKVPQLKLPTKFFDISYKPDSKNTVIVTCDNGWALSFRIHNASTYVEPSLKFDVQLVGVPQSLHMQVEPW